MIEACSSVPMAESTRREVRLTESPYAISPGALGSSTLIRERRRRLRGVMAAWTALLGVVSLAPTADAATIQVPADQPTIQAAIDVALPGDVIVIAPGTYVESLIVDPLGAYGPARPASGADDIQLVAAAAGVTVTWPAAATRSGSFNPLITTTSGRQIDAILTIRGTSSAFAIDGVDFDGADDMNPGLSTSTHTTTGIYSREAGGAMNGCSVRHVQISPTSGAQSGLAVLVESPGGGNTFSLTSCEFSDNQKGFLVVNSDGACDVSDCTLVGRGPTTSLAQNAIQYSFGGTGSVTNTVIDGFWWTGNFTAVATGMLLFSSGSGVAVNGCTFLDCQVGLYDTGATASITTTITGSTFTQTVFPPPTSFYPAGIIFTDGDAGNAFTISECAFIDHEDVGVALFTEGGTISNCVFNANGKQFSQINAQDEGAGAGPSAGLGNNWDSNCYSNYASNAGYPGSYLIYGALGSTDVNPNVSCPGFGPGVNVAVGVAPCDVILADLSGDAIPDVATADSGSDTVTVLTNDGTGAFPSSTTVSLTSGDSPASLDAGDLVVGGGNDIAVAARDANVVRIIENNPVGTFAVVASISTAPATQPVSVVVSDLDGSGVDDIVCALQGDALLVGTGAVSVSLNGGPMSTLTPPVGGFLRPQSVAACDLDGDGDNDVVATMMGTPFSPTVSDNVLLYENLGGGVFGAPIALSVAQNPRGLCCLDIDDDGDADLAVTAESFPSLLPGSIELFLNGGLTAGAWIPGAFSSGGSFSSGTAPTDLACGDLTDDSIPGFCARYDLVAVNFGSENVSRLNGYVPGSNVFTQSEVTNANLVPVAVAVAELSGDKTPDIVVCNKASNDVTIRIDITPALAKRFGVGCPGQAGVPQISAVGLPSYLNPAFGVRLTNGRPFAPVLMGLSLNQFTTVLTGGCSLYLLPPLVLIPTVTNGAGETVINLSIPGPVIFGGCDAFFQYFVFDPAGPYLGQFAFSDALRIKVGNP